MNSSPHSKSRGIQVGLFPVRLFFLGLVALVLLIGVAWAFGAFWFDFPLSALRRPLPVNGFTAARAYELRKTIPISRASSGQVSQLNADCI